MPRALTLLAVLLLACRPLPTTGDTWTPPDREPPKVVDPPVDTAPPDPPSAGPTRTLFDRDFSPAVRDVIDAATREIRVAQFLWQDTQATNELLEALTRAAARGVTVRVLADEAGGDTPDQLAVLERAGAEARLDSPWTTLHTKMWVADDVVVLGSHNLTGSALTSNHEGSVLVADATVAAWYAAWFDAVWNDEPAPEPPVHEGPYHPTADTYITATLLDCLTPATSRIDLVLYAMAWDDRYPGSEVDQLLTALTQAHDRGVDVRVVLDGSPWIRDNAINDDAIARLRAEDVDVWTTPSWVTTHAKVVRCDDEVVIGDANWSYSGLVLYRGVSLSLTDPALLEETVSWMDDVRESAEPVP